MCFMSVFITTCLPALALNILDCLDKPNKDCKGCFHIILNSVPGFIFFKQYFWVWRFKSIKSRPVSVNIYLSQSCVWSWHRADQQRCEGSCYHTEQKKKCLEQPSAEQFPALWAGDWRLCVWGSTQIVVFALKSGSLSVSNIVTAVSPSLNECCHSQSCPLPL